MDFRVGLRATVPKAQERTGAVEDDWALTMSLLKAFWSQSTRNLLLPEIEMEYTLKIHKSCLTLHTCAIEAAELK